MAPDSPRLRSRRISRRVQSATLTVVARGGMGDWTGGFRESERRLGRNGCSWPGQAMLIDLKCQLENALSDR